MILHCDLKTAGVYTCSSATLAAVDGSALVPPEGAALRPSAAAALDHPLMPPAVVAASCCRKSPDRRSYVFSVGPEVNIA